ncbi:MAG: hypothetical protein ABJ092_02910 [Gillisia sp.]
MKAKLHLFLLFCITLFSCQTGNLKPSSSENVSSEMGDFTYSKIGVEENGTLKLLVTENSILKSSKRFSSKLGQDINPQSLTIESINGKKFLRIFNDDNTVSTVELTLDNSNFYFTGGTICKSKPNSPGEGCVPKGEYCTPSSKGTDSGEFCERTTASKGLVVGH